MKSVKTSVTSTRFLVVAVQIIINVDDLTEFTAVPEVLLLLRFLAGLPGSLALRHNW